MAMTYEGVLRKLGRRVSVQLDKVRGTEIRRAPGEAGERGDLEVRYHGNAIVTVHPDGTYTLRTYGKPQRIYLTRISEYAPVSLVRRGRSVYLQEPNAQTLIPFLDGMRVDVTGHLVGEWATHAEQHAIALDSSGKKPAATVIDEARLRLYVRRLIREEMAGTVGLSPAAIVDRVTEATHPPAAVKATLTATAIPVTHAIADNPDYIRSLMLKAGADPKKIERVLKDVRGSVYRGRGNGDGEAHELASAHDTAPASTAAAPPRIAPNIPASNCADCGLNLIAHYDRANRFKGCQYAADHREDLTLI